MKEMIMETTLMTREEKKNQGLFVLGKLVSLLGSSIYTFAIGLYVLRVTGSAFQFATTLVFSMVPMLLAGPVAGVVADRFDKKKLVVGMDLISGVIMLMLYLMTMTRPLGLGAVYASVFFLTLASTFFNIALESAKPRIVHEDRLVSVNAAAKVVDSLATIGGPMIGGLIYALVDIRFFILFNGLSFLLSALSEMFIDFNLFGEEADLSEKFTFLSDVSEGMNYLKKDRDSQFLMMIFLFLNFVLSFSVLVPLPFMVNEVFKLEARSYGLIQGASSVGLILGALVVSWVLKRIAYERLLIGINRLMGLCILAMGIPFWWGFQSFEVLSLTALYTGIMVIIGVAIAMIDVPIMAIMQKKIPGHLLGRVMSLVVTLAKVISPLGVLLSGLLIKTISPLWIVTTGGLGLMLMLLTLFYSFWMKRISLEQGAS